MAMLGSKQGVRSQESGVRIKLALACFLVAAGLGRAQDQSLPQSSIAINLPPDAPVTLMSSESGESRATARGGALLLDLHLSLKLRNNSSHRIHGLTMIVSAQEVTPGGKGSWAPWLDVGAGEVFPLQIDIRLLRPLQPQSGPMVQVGLDGILFNDFSFYGPNLLDSRRAMMVRETEAQRDRQYLKSVLAKFGPEALRRLALDSLNRQDARPRLDVQVSRGGRSTSAAAGGGERQAQFAFLQIPDSPVEPLDGSVRIAGNEAKAPRIEVRNRSSKAIRYFEIGWIVRDSQGKEVWAASVPASGGDLNLKPGQTGRAQQDTALRFSKGQGEPVAVHGATGFVSQVEYTDGKIWVPDRASLENAQLLSVIAPSMEEERLTDLYRKKGLPALIEDLKK
jgi:hypothetical protein